MRVGVIYDVTLKLVTEDFRQIYPIEVEQNVRPQIKAMIRDGIAALGEELTPWRIKLPEDINRIVFKSQRPVEALDEVAFRILNRGFTDYDKAVFAINVMEKIHDKWVECNTDFLLKQMHSSASIQYLCMPFWLLGFDSAQRYLSFITPLFRVLGLNPEPHRIRKVYAEKQRLFLMGYHRIKDISDLYEYVANPDYPALNEKIKAALAEGGVAARIAEQIAYRNPERF